MAALFYYTVDIFFRDNIFAIFFITTVIIIVLEFIPNNFSLILKPALLLM